jgi:polysaccharide pyruvyl transferase WcaK-like protein
LNGRNRVLLFGNYDGTNVGDNCILVHVLRKFAECSSNICIPSRRPLHIVERCNVDSANLLSFRFISEFIKSDELIIGGGGIFSRYVGPYAKFLPLFAIAAKLFGKKVVYYNVGVYNTTPFLVKELVKLSMSCSDEISIRDEASLNAIGFVNKIKNVKTASDPGLTLEPINDHEARSILRNEGVQDGFLVGLSLKSTMDKEINVRIVSEFSKFSDWVIEEFDAKVVFFPFSFNQIRAVENDIAIAEKVHQAMKTKNRKNFRIIQAGMYAPDEIKGIIGVMNVLLGMRFHSLVFAYSARTPLIGVSYEEKCKDFLQSRLLPFVEVERAEFGVLKNLFLSSVMGDKQDGK